MLSDIRKAHQGIVALRNALLMGGSAEIGECVTDLEGACGLLRHLETGPSSRDELEALRAELNRTARLIEHGDNLWRGWARILGAAAGYTSAGEPAALAASGQLSVRG
jgi:hypothetical protein